MQGEGFKLEFRVMKVAGCDLLLGMDWIDLMAPINLHTRPRSVTFMRGTRMVTLVSYHDSLDWAITIPS